MDVSKKYKKKSFNVIVLSMLLLGGVVAAVAYYGLDWLLTTFSSQQGQDMIVGAVPDGIALLKLIFLNFYAWVVPGVMGVFLVLGLLAWAVMAVFISPIMRSATVELETVPPKKAGKKDFIDHKVEQERKRRLFLHTLAVLQREGRLLDFFDEDLSDYEDEQIGAAVRSIQEDCKKAIKKYIDPQPVVSGQEGDRITIEEGFDIDAINLVGNVSGQPPFEGIIKHPGWRAGKKDVPKLSDVQDPGIMTPAEIEIQ